MIENRKDYEALEIVERKKYLYMLTSAQAAQKMEDLLNLPLDELRRHKQTEPVALNLLIHGKKAV